MQSDVDPSPVPSAAKAESWRITVKSRSPLDLPESAHSDGRAHREGDPVPNYSSFAASTAVREFSRHLDPDLNPTVRASRLMFAGLVLDGRTSAVQRWAVVTADDLMDADDMSAAQRLAQKAWEAGADAVLLPSAADGPGDGTNLVVRHEAAPRCLRVVSETIVRLSDVD